ncbi:MAG: hypothetical protein VXW31_07710, partial [Planctomycetota bacterium]|nr:hypothetical protein [Planctomycetota bacterium]
MSSTAPIASLLGLTLAFALSGCGGAAAPENPAPSAGLDGPAATPAAGAEGPEPIIAPPLESSDGGPALDLPEGWRRYEDPVSGGSFGHPRGWLVRPAQGALVLLPDDHREDRELISVAAVDAQGAT